MRILIINPNTTASMTEAIGKAALKVASVGTTIVAVNPDNGPASIQGAEDGEAALPGLFEAFDRHMTADDPFDAVVIACFDDTGLDAARCVTDKPVIGIGEAAYSMAGMLANKFSVVTTLARSVPALEHNLMKYGLDRRCARVRSSEVAVLDLEDDSSGAYEKIAAEIARAIADDKAEAIVLGCAGMTDLANKLSQQFGRPVLDGVACAVSLAESMARLQLKTSRHGGYAPPPQHKLEVQS